MNSISSRTCGGAIAAVAAVAFLAITAIALAVIFAPPFFATALLAGVASYIAIGCGIAFIAAGIAAVVLLSNNPTSSKVDHAETKNDIDSQVSAYLDEMKSLEWPEDIYEHNFVNDFIATLNQAKTHPSAAQGDFKASLEEILEKMNLDSDEGANCDNAREIHDQLLELLNVMENEHASDTAGDATST